MFEFIKAGGWLMLPILACSVAALTIILDRLWFLRRARVLPSELLAALREAARGGSLLDFTPRGPTGRSPLGKIVATAIIYRTRPRAEIKENIEDAGRQIVHDLERYLNLLGTIAAISPLLGLLGSVFGIIDVFAVIAQRGSTNIEVLAGGIAKALITTAGGLAVAIPSLFFYRYFHSKIDAYALRMEQEAVRLVNTLQGD